MTEEWEDIVGSFTMELLTTINLNGYIAVTHSTRSKDSFNIN